MAEWQTPKGKMQAAFVASSTLKRNRRYLDIDRINEAERSSYQRSRKPYSSSKSIEHKIKRSFSNSTAILTDKLHKDIMDFKAKHSSRPSTASAKTSRESTPDTHNIRGVQIGQHISREQYYKPKSKPVLDERLFNNYRLDPPNTSRTYDLSRGPQRNFDNSLKHINTNLYHQSQSPYEEFFYKKTTMNCRIIYKKQPETERSFFNTVRPENKPATQLSPTAVRKAQEAVEVNSNCIDSFYMNSGRELPCQLEERTGSALTSHWRNSKGVIERPQVDYSTRIMKEKLQSQRKDKIKQSKKPNFSRQQICDKKYFIINHKI